MMGSRDKKRGSGQSFQTEDHILLITIFTFFLMLKVNFSFSIVNDIFTYDMQIKIVKYSCS